MVIICKLRNNTLRKFAGMKGEVMTTGNRKGTSCGAQKRRAGEEGLVRVPSTFRGRGALVSELYPLGLRDTWGNTKQRRTEASEGPCPCPEEVCSLH